MKYTLYTLLLFIAVNCCEAQKFKPVLNLVKGNTYYLTTDARSVITQTAAGQQINANLSVSFQMDFKVIDMADTIYNMEASYRSVSMKMEPLDLDSKKSDPQDTASAIFAAIMNKPFNLKLSKSGKIISVQNFDTMISGALKGLPQIDSVKRQQIGMQFAKSFGPNAFKESLETGAAIFPANAVAKEETWTVKGKLESPAKAAITIHYQLADVVDGTYVIHGEGTIITDKITDPASIKDSPIKYDLTGSMIADIRVDKATGWINEVKLKQIMMGSMQIPESPSLPGGLTIPIKFNTDVNITGIGLIKR